MYKSLPSRKIKFIDQIPGAVITSAGWVSFSILFSFFVDNFSNYANIYGSLTAIIVLMLWMYICMYIMFIGAELNCILASKIYGTEKSE
jgi:membrane protein